MNHSEAIHIICTDGYKLSGDYYPSQVNPSSNNSKPYPILICSATGVTKGFYSAFATWLTTQGFDVLCFDFRGIGQSLHGELKDSNARIQDWGLLDIPAAIETLLNKTKAEKVILIGHSAGGQLLGITPNHHKVARLIAVSGSTGYVKGLKGRTKILAPLMFNLIFPVSSKIKGYGGTHIGH